MWRRRRQFILSAACVAIAWIVGTRAGLASGAVQSTDQHVRPSGLCVNEEGASFSPGALRKVSTQAQKCDAGAWVFDPSNPPSDPTLAKAKSCRSRGAADRGQAYAAGLLRSVASKLERCDDGKWVPVPARSGGHVGG